MAEIAVRQWVALSQSTQTPGGRLNATALIARSSLSYLRQVFALNHARMPLLNVQPSDADKPPPEGIEIVDRRNSEEGGGWFTEHHPLIRDDAPAQVTFTSGTEGPPKGIVLSYANLADAADRITSQMQMTAEIREYVGVPVTFSFGIARIRAVSAVGGHSYIPPRGFDPLELARMLKAGEVNALSAVPTLLRILIQSPGAMDGAGERLRWLEIGSQYMSAAEKRAVRIIFPNARIVQHYGLTEASRSTFLQVSSCPVEFLESVGQPVGKTQIAISEDGRIRIRGPHVAQWRIEAGRLTPTLDKEGWLQTNDLGHLRDGHLFYEGRADDLINVGGIKINPDQVETRLRERLGSDCPVVVAKMPDALRGEGVLVVTQTPGPDLERLRQVATDVLKGLGLEASGALSVWQMSTLPVTSTGKPKRREISKAYAERSTPVAAVSGPVAVAPTANKPLEGESPDILQLFCSFFRLKSVRPTDSFETLGGDSLNYIQFSMAFEKRFGALPNGWQKMSVLDLQNSMKTSVKSFWRPLDSATLTRAFFMTCIVALHLDTFVYSANWGAAYFLYMLAGYSVVRFQWPEIDRTGSVKPIFATMLRVAVPTLLVTIALQLWVGKFEWKPLLLISNFFDPREHIIYFYFAEMYIQLLLLAALMFSIPAVRRAFREAPLLISCVLAWLTFVDVQAIERLWDTNYIYHRSPHWYAWTFACGMAIASASVRGIKSRLLAMLVIGTLVFDKFGLTSAAGYVCAGSALLLFAPVISVPAPVKTIVSELAAATMFMYLSHFQVKSLVTKFFHAPAPWVALFAAMIVGIVFARVYGKLEQAALAFIAKQRASPTGALGSRA